MSNDDHPDGVGVGLRIVRDEVRTASRKEIGDAGEMAGNHKYGLGAVVCGARSQSSEFR